MPLHIPPRLRRIARLIAWNALLTFAGLGLIGIIGEVYLRLTVPFMDNSQAERFVPGVGLLWEPGMTVRWTNGRDYWTIARANSLGFLDREPPSPEQAAAGCHIAIIGDSFIDAREVSIADKMPAQLEQLAAQSRPEWNVTTAAYSISGAGPVQQLPLYDQYAQRLRPDLLTLVFVSNDFADSSVLVSGMLFGYPSDGLPWATAVKDRNGNIALRQPRHPPTSPAALSYPALRQSLRNTLAKSYFLRWLLFHYRSSAIPTRPAPALHFDFWSQPRLAPELEYTAFALDEFQKRAHRDGATLAILATHTMRNRNSTYYNILSEMAQARGIPIIDQHDYIIRQGVASAQAAHWPRDTHWNPAGHRWAAAALLEWMQQNPQVCAPPP